jgi:arginyl-tRNA synthetase
MSLRKLKLEYPEIFTEKKYPEQDAGDPGVSMEYYIDEIIGLDDYTYDDYLGKHKLTLEEERKLKKNYGFSNTKKEESIMVEYCSPNTNKPLHLGHIRNCLLGNSIS